MKGNQYNDFSALKGLKKELEKADAPAQKESTKDGAKLQEKRTRVVQHLSRDEEKARSAGITKGCKVRMMDSNDSGVVVGVGKDFHEIDIDGLVIRATQGEFILVDAQEDRMMYASMPSSPKKHSEKVQTVDPSGELVVDLHFERIPGNESVPEWAALEYQMNWFRKTIRENQKHRGRRIVFIHGDGDGTLKEAVRKELDEVFAVTCSYTYGDSDRYGTGATVVTIR